MQLPNPLPISPIRQFIDFLGRPYDFLDGCAKSYGDTFTIKLIGYPSWVILANPQAISELFAIDGKLFDAGKNNAYLQPLVGNNSLFLLDSDRHKRERKMLMPPFHGEKVKSYARIVAQVAKRVASTWQSQRPFLASKAMQEITLDVILHTVFGLSEGERYQQIKPLLIKLLDLTGSPLRASLLYFPALQQDWGPWSPWGKFVGQRRQIYDLLQAEIDQRRKQLEIQGNDVLSLMLLARDEAGEPMTDAELRDELITMLLAGYETTATALTWALYWVYKLPSVREKLLQELDIQGNDAEPLELANLPYLSAVCNEALRIYPLVPFATPRSSRIALEIAGYQFGPETTLVPCIYLVHRREDIYPEPDQFKPERFLKRQFSPAEFIAFGGGNRRCLGYALAMLEMKVILATIVSKYELTLANKKPEKPRRRGVTLAPASGVKMIVTGTRVHRQKQFLLA